MTLARTLLSPTSCTEEEDIPLDALTVDISQQILASNNNLDMFLLPPKTRNAMQSRSCKASTAARVCFVSHKSQYDYISIENQRGCYSALGRQGGRQGLSLNRQGYSDRDSYITINWNNMNQQMAYNYFLKSTNYLNTPYDYFPIMQYERSCQSTCQTEATTTPTTPSFPNQGIPINQRQGLSFWDVHSINLLYNCSNN
uniref:Metalloendopeptidase n=1 Tax=Periophthalmus magnuspinnatus TaxID=409849 RepID=A0A3B4B3P2_9GOBI